MKIISIKSSIALSLSLVAWSNLGLQPSTAFAGTGNTAYGVSALTNVTTGAYNTANGYQALQADISGSYNTAQGAQSMYYNTNGQDNTAVGASALLSNIGGSQNTAVGDTALFLNQGGSGNTAIGYGAMGNTNTINGSYNIALGYQAGFNITGGDNIDIGNTGSSGDTNVMRLGTAGQQVTTYIAGVINGNGNDLTNLALQNVNGALPASTTYTVSGNESGGWGTPVVLIKNNNTNSTASPALRVVGNGDTFDGVLSVSSQGSGLIAEFGNADAFVSSLDINGNWSATSFNVTSDRNVKANFQPVSAQEILAKVAALPITRWNYKNMPAVPHVGPMAQDFYDAFNVGTDNRHIATVDEDGVALAAIQGLNQKLEEKDAEIQKLEKQLDDLSAVVKSMQK